MMNAETSSNFLEGAMDRLFCLKGKDGSTLRCLRAGLNLNKGAPSQLLAWKW